MDWPTRHHFSYQRAQLLHPLRIGERHRVLEVGAGSGPLTRHPALAAAARHRCHDLGRVDVREIPLGGLGRETFDVVLLCGALEHAGPGTEATGGVPALLGGVRSHLREDGALVVVTRNQLGLRYLLGAPDELAGRPWAGIDGYAGAPGPRTWTRRELSEMLGAAGLGDQRWMAPFPDHLLPSVVLDQSAYEQPDAPELVEQLVLDPVGGLARPPARLADGGAAHDVLARAGLAFDVANSYLVVAGRSADAVSALVPDDVLAWLFGGIRVDPWRRVRVLTSERRLVTLGSTEHRCVGWLRQDPGTARRFRNGRTLHRRALAAVRAHDLDELVAVLRAWRDELDARAVDVAAGSGPAPHPFLLGDTVRGLPDGHLDVALSNFVETDDRPLLVDDERRTGHPVDLRMARHRALWNFARELVTLGVEHPWGDLASVDDVMRELAGLAGIDLDDRVAAALGRAEAELQGLVAGEWGDRVLSGWYDGSLRAVDLVPGANVLPGPRGDELVRMAAAHAELTAAHAELATAHAELTHDTDRLRSERDWLAAERSEFMGRASTTSVWSPRSKRRSRGCAVREGSWLTWCDGGRRGDAYLPRGLTSGDRAVPNEVPAGRLVHDGVRTRSPRDVRIRRRHVAVGCVGS